MTAHQKDPLYKEEKGLIGWLNSGIGLLGWRLLVLISLALLAVLAWQGKNIGYEFIAQSPSNIANTQAIADAQAAVAAAKSAADTANQKADQTLALSSKIFDAIKDLKDDTQATKISIASSQATITAQVGDLGNRLSRIEAKQDAGR